MHGHRLGERTQLLRCHARRAQCAAESAAAEQRRAAWWAANAEAWARGEPVPPIATPAEPI